MVASKVVIVLFTTLFMGFISLLLVFSIYSSVHDTTQVSEIGDELTHQELIFDLDSAINTSCSFCEKRTLRSLFCSSGTYIIAVGVLDIDTNHNQTGNDMYLVRETAEMKSVPLLREPLTRMIVETESLFPFNESLYRSVGEG